MGRQLGCGLFGIGDAAVMTYFYAFSAGNAFLRVNPILCVLHANGVHGTFHPALVAGGAELLINHIGHRDILLFSSASII